MYTLKNTKVMIQKFVALIILLLSSIVSTASSVLIWPLNPIIEEPEKATSVWVQNNGQAPIFFQVRILKWQQIEGKDKLIEQQAVLASPPFAEIAAGKKQLIRIIRNTAIAPKKEQSYRILIDEIPRDNTNTDKHKQALGITFQMRYSIPLFIQGENIWTDQNYKRPRDINKANQPLLNYKVITLNKEKKALIIQNTGNVHARLSGVYFQQGSKKFTIADGLLGYVLPNQTIAFPIPPQINTLGILKATVNEIPKPMTINLF